MNPRKFNKYQPAKPSPLRQILSRSPSNSSISSSSRSRSSHGSSFVGQPQPKFPVRRISSRAQGLGPTPSSQGSSSPSSSSSTKPSTYGSTSFDINPASSGYTQGTSFQINGPPPSRRPLPTKRRKAKDASSTQSASPTSSSSAPQSSARPPSPELGSRPASNSAFYAEMEKKLQKAEAPPDFDVSDDDSDPDLEDEQPQTQSKIPLVSNDPEEIRQSVEENELEESDIPSDVTRYGTPVRDDEDAYADIDYRNPSPPDANSHPSHGYYYGTEGEDVGAEGDEYYYGSSTNPNTASSSSPYNARSSICSTNASSVFTSSRDFSSSRASPDDVDTEDKISPVNSKKSSPASSGDVSMADVIEEDRGTLEANLEIFWTTPCVVWFASWLYHAFDAASLETKVAALGRKVETLKGIEDTLGWMAWNEEMAGDPDKGARYRQKHHEMTEMRLGVADGRVVEVPVFAEPPPGFEHVLTWFEYLRLTILRPMEWVPLQPIDPNGRFSSVSSPRSWNRQVRFSPPRYRDVAMLDVPEPRQTGKKKPSFRVTKPSASPGVQPSQRAGMVSETHRRENQKAPSQPARGHPARPPTSPRKSKRQNAKRQFRAPKDGQQQQQQPQQQPPPQPVVKPEPRRGPQRACRSSSSYRDDPLSNGRPRKDNRRRDRY